jgi:hypothetical protein
MRRGEGEKQEQKQEQKQPQIDSTPLKYAALTMTERWLLQSIGIFEGKFTARLRHRERPNTVTWEDSRRAGGRAGLHAEHVVDAEARIH